jgi:hypothetical protein
MGFLEYADISFRAFLHSDRQKELAQRKHSIVQGVYDHYGITPKTVLYIGFNPAITLAAASKVYVADVSPEVMTWLDSNNVQAEEISVDDLGNRDRTFDAVIALDEYFTFADSEDDQRAKFEMICKATRGVVITTVRDYKNLDFKDREFSVPVVVRGESDDLLFLEYHNYSDPDRNSWVRNVYEIEGTGVRATRGFNCRHMFFKQCAKFGYDAGAREFLVHKNLMYKGLIRKNYEHVISIKFG